MVITSDSVFLHGVRSGHKLAGQVWHLCEQREKEAGDGSRQEVDVGMHVFLEAEDIQQRVLG